MIIVLDTNIIMENWLFDKPYHKALIDYINKSVDCQVVFPQIVWSEIRAKYKSELKDALNKQASANRTVGKYIYISNDYDPFGDSMKELKENAHFIDIDKAYDDYSEYLLATLLCGYHSIIEYPDGVLPRLAEKAIARIKPFSTKGEEFRDAILWQSVLNIAHEYDELNPIVFISKNTNEFSDITDKNKLHPELEYEVNALKDKVVLYYTSVEDFIKAHLEPIEHINWVWTLENVESIGLNNHILNYIEGIRSDVMLRFAARFNDVIFDAEGSPGQLKLRAPGLFYVSQEETIYTYKNGDVSLFANFDGTLILPTSYYPRLPSSDFSRYDNGVARTVNTSNYSPGYTEFPYHFTTQIELTISEKSLVYKAVASFVMKGKSYEPTSEKWLRYDVERSMNQYDEENDLPF
ncbi:PIN domain-containing protein [Hymenobacter sp. M29]|uniref:PIN domain-containing protein n=1 Tax=Hymenobacter mellowenesis TaxID=3063995 RepID=A0ABT9AI85_9BACT|nr:PIN domain-containing protein [Hymenobacter sp. M29]MDO7849585.1 PIN domain-containing protein [Hymenobacter sp. M29]